MVCHQWPFDSIIPPDILPSSRKGKRGLKDGHWTDRMGQIVHSKEGIFVFLLFCLFVFLSLDLSDGLWSDRMERIAHSKVGIISATNHVLFVYLCHRVFVYLCHRVFVADAFVYLSDAHL